MAFMQLGETRDPYSYQDDAAVPAFDDGGPVVFMDGDCLLCSKGARLVARLDRAQRFKICAIQSELGRAVLRHYGLDPTNPDSWLFLNEGRAYSSLDAMIRAGAALGGLGWLLQPLRLLPRPLQDWLYRRVARNRYRLFGRADLCAVADPALRARLIG
ncbi:MAG: DCC1-like thiol-disulfide oxidoreductase family protein [Rhodospirillales bacterium]